MPVSLTTPGWADARNNASDHVAFRKTDDVGTRDFQAFAAQWLAYAFPYRRFDAALADCAARLGADAGCYSFIVADFHHLLLAGFAGAPVCKNYETGKKALQHVGFLLFLTPSALSASASEYQAVANGRVTCNGLQSSAPGLAIIGMSGSR